MHAFRNLNNLYTDFSKSLLEFVHFLQLIFFFKPAWWECSGRKRVEGEGAQETNTEIVLISEKCGPDNHLRQI